MFLLHLALPLFLLLVIPDSFAQSGVGVPGPKEPERKAILDALRTPVEKELKEKVVFKVDHLKVQGEWAFMRGVPRQSSGKALDYRRTKYEQAIKDGIFDDWICALLRKRQGEWRVVTYVIGATDVAYDGWDETYKVPPAIFKE